MKRDLVSYAVMTAVAKGMQFLMLPLLTRLFTPESYGLIELITTLTGLLTILMSLSLESALARRWPEAQSQGGRAHLLSSALAFAAGFGVALFLIFWMFAEDISVRLAGLPEAKATIVTACATALALSLSGLPQMALRMEGRVFRFGMLQVLQSVLSIGLALLLMLEARMGLYGLFLGNLLGSLIVLALGVFWVREHLRWVVSPLQLRDCLKYSLPLTPAVLITWANGQADRLILMSLLGPAVVGIFGAAAKIAAIVTVLVEVFRLAWLPAAMRHLDDGQARDAFFGQGLSNYLAAMCSIGLVLVAFSRELLVTLTTGDYADGYALIPWLIGAQILYGSGSITNAGMLASRKTAGNSFAATLGTLLNIGLGLTLVGIFGMWGSAIGSFVAALAFTTSLLWLSSRQVNIRFDIGSAVGIVSIYASASAGVLWLYRLPADSSLPARCAVLVAAIVAIGLTCASSLRRGEREVEALT